MSLDLPNGVLGAPMTYLLDGVQHIALTVGGGGLPTICKEGSGTRE